MSGKSTIERAGHEILPADQRKKFDELLRAGKEREAAKLAQKWIPDAVRSGRITEGEGTGLCEALNIAEANSLPTPITQNA